MPGKTPKKKLSPLKRSSFSSPQLATFVLIFAAIGGYLLFHSLAAGPLVASLEAEQMSLPPGGSVVTDTSASAGKAIQLAANGMAGGSVNFPSSVASVTVSARGDQCSGAPAMTVSLDGANLLSGTAVTSTSWSSYSASPAVAINAGVHSLAISFTNDYNSTKSHGKSGKTTVCDRNLYVDVTSFYGSAPTPTPSPTITLSASPASVTAGSASTLTWASTNASSCAASGAWSGTKPASGSASTGALNQNSTYVLACTGLGGSVTASATVSVSSPPISSSSRWFADTSYINTVVPATPPLDPNNAQFQQAIRTTTYIWANGTSAMGGQWATTVYHSASSTPMRTISLVVPYGGSYSVTFPYATGWEPTPDTDGHMAVIQPDGTFWEFQGLDQAVTKAHSAARHSISGDALNTSLDAVSPIPTIAGLIRPEEIAAGVINHGIRTGVPFASSQVRSPAIWSDGNTSGGPPSGAHLWLPRNADLSSLTDPYQKMVAKAMQEYGMWIGDFSGSFSIPVQSTWNNNASYPFTSLSLPQQIVNQLVVIAQ